MDGDENTVMSMKDNVPSVELRERLLIEVVKGNQLRWLGDACCMRWMVS